MMLSVLKGRAAQGAGAKPYRGRLASDGNAAQGVLWVRAAHVTSPRGH